MNHQWQQPIRPMVYQMLHQPKLPAGVDYNPIWAPVLFIRPTNDGWEIMGEPGCVWGPNHVTLRVVGQ